MMLSVAENERLPSVVRVPKVIFRNRTTHRRARSASWGIIGTALRLCVSFVQGVIEGNAEILDHNQSSAQKHRIPTIRIYLGTRKLLL